MLFGLTGSLFFLTCFQEGLFDFTVSDGFMKQVRQESLSCHTTPASPCAHTSYLPPPSLGSAFLS